MTAELRAAPGRRRAWSSWPSAGCGPRSSAAPSRPASGWSRSSSPAGSGSAARRCGRRCGCSGSRAWSSTCRAAGSGSWRCRRATSTSCSACATCSSASRCSARSTAAAPPTRTGSRSRAPPSSAWRPARGDATEQAAAHRAFHLSLVALAGHQHLHARLRAAAAAAAALHGHEHAPRGRAAPGDRGRAPAPAALRGRGGRGPDVVLDELTHHGSRTYLAPGAGPGLSPPRSSHGVNARRSSPDTKLSTIDDVLPQAAPPLPGRGRATAASSPDPHASSTPCSRASPTGRDDAAWISRRSTPAELRARADELAARGPAGPPALRRPVRGQGQHRRRRAAHHRRLPGLRLHARTRTRARVARLLAAGAIARRQDQPRPVRHRPDRHPLPVRRARERRSAAI